VDSDNDIIQTPGAAAGTTTFCVAVDSRGNYMVSSS
jgi:hypothetical protein